MNYAQSIQKKISRLPSGEVFSTDTLNISSTPTIRKILSRLESKGSIQRLDGTQGLYFVPREGRLGPLKPSRGKIIKALLSGQKKGYRSGLPFYNKMGLTTQVPGGIIIMSKMYPKVSKIGNIDIKFKKSRAPITKNNIPMLQYLDALLDIKKIPDTTPSKVITSMKMKIKQFESSEIKRLVKLSEYYPSRVQALLGAILDDTGFDKYSAPLKKVINSGSLYQIGVTEESLPNKLNWSIQ